MAVVLLPTPPFWLTMATIVLTAGILARRSSVWLNQHPTAALPQPRVSGDTARESALPSRSLRGSALCPRPLEASRPAPPARCSPREREELGRLPAPLHVPAGLSWRWPTHRPRAGARNTRQPPIAGLPPCSLRRRKPHDVPSPGRRVPL